MNLTDAFGYTGMILFIAGIIAAIGAGFWVADNNRTTGELWRAWATALVFALAAMGCFIASIWVGVVV